jgi:hypothetical protein
MAISGDYAHPVFVNGYACKNCTEVDEAKKHIDPAHPKDGPFGVNAKKKPSDVHGPAVLLDGRLATVDRLAGLGPSRLAADPTALSGRRLDITA